MIRNTSKLISVINVYYQLNRGKIIVLMSKRNFEDYFEREEETSMCSLRALIDSFIW